MAVYSLGSGKVLIGSSQWSWQKGGDVYHCSQCWEQAAVISHWIKFHKASDKTKQPHRVHRHRGDMNRQYQEGSIEQATKKLQVSLVTREISFLAQMIYLLRILKITCQGYCKLRTFQQEENQEPLK